MVTKASNIAEVIQSIYYNGRPKLDKKLDRRDFLQLVNMANGTIIRKLYYEERQAGQVQWFFSPETNTKDFELSDADQRGRRSFEIKGKKKGEEFEGVMRMPKGIGVLDLRDADSGERISRIATGSAWMYMGRAYEGKMFYEQKGIKIITYNVPSCIKKVEMDGMFNLTDMDIPYDIAFDICNSVLGLTLKVAGFPVDKTNDQDPNLLNVKNRLTNPETI